MSVAGTRLAWSALAVLALLLAGLPLLSHGAMQGATSPASPVPVARALDLAAMALTPDDLDAAGLRGFGQQSSAFLTLQEQAEQAAPVLGMEPKAIASALVNAGFQRRYQRQLGLPAPAEAASSRLQTFVAPYILEYTSAAGAAAGFALLETDQPGVAKGDVPGTRPIGERSEVTRLRRAADTRQPYRALDLTFQIGNLVAGITVGEFGDREPDLAMVETLGERLLAKVEAGRMGGGPGLSNLAVRLEGTGVATRSDEYGRLDGETFPNFDETADELAERQARYGDAVDVYGVTQSIARGSRTPADDLRYLALLMRFETEDAAAAWLDKGEAREPHAPNVMSATPVAGAATIGDASLTLATTTDRGAAGTARGYLIDTRVGTQVAQVQVTGLPEAPLTVVEDLARTQVACLQSGACPDWMPAPVGLPESPPATSVASPIANGHDGLPDSCIPGESSLPDSPSPISHPHPLTPSPAAVGEGETPPNIVVILTDDLDARSVACMPNVQSLLAAQGLTFRNAFVTTPLCCPSRASILRGQYAHNHGVLGNTGAHGGFPAFYRLGDDGSTVATWLQAAGYRTALYGKYLNRYPKGAPETYVPPGWDEWAAFASVANGGAYYNDYTLNENGTLVAYGRDTTDYSTDVLTGMAADFVESSAESGEPFFLYLAPYAPHGPSTAAERHAGAFAGARAERAPSFDEADVGDKPAWIRGLPELSTAQIALVDERYQERLRSLLAVDEMVADVVETLELTGTLDTTYIVFSSDNGFQLGEHRLPLGKQSPYDESIRVPLIVRGPGVPVGGDVEQIALNIDLAPTFAELGGATVPDFIDGRSLAPLLKEETPPSGGDSSPLQGEAREGAGHGGEMPADWREGFLVEHYDHTSPETWGTPAAVGRAGTPVALEEPEEEEGVPGIAPVSIPPYLALRTERYLYVEYETGERELYDLERDPYQMQNLAATAGPDLLDRLSTRLAQLRTCAAAACRAAEDDR